MRFALFALFISTAAHAEPFQFVAFLGDSITEGSNLTAQPWPQLVVSRRAGDNLAGANHANSGEQLAQIALRYTNQVKNRGYHTVVIGPIVNDIPGAVSGAAIYAALLTLCQEIQADGHALVISTTLPFKNAAGYDTVGNETKRQALNTLIRAAPSGDLPGAVVVDMDVALRSAGDATVLDATYVSGGDYLHPNNAGQAAMADVVDAAVSW